MVLQGRRGLFCILKDVPSRKYSFRLLEKRNPLDRSASAIWLTTCQERPSQDPHLPKSELYYFPERRVQRAGVVISVLLSAILLVGAIICLTAVSNRSTSVRVGMIVLFTCLFAGVVGLLTNARRAEIFGSTAA